MAYVCQTVIVSLMLILTAMFWQHDGWDLTFYLAAAAVAVAVVAAGVPAWLPSLRNVGLHPFPVHS